MSGPPVAVLRNACARQRGGHAPSELVIARRMLTKIAGDREVRLPAENFLRGGPGLLHAAEAMQRGGLGAQRRDMAVVPQQGVVCELKSLRIAAGREQRRRAQRLVVISERIDRRESPR